MPECNVLLIGGLDPQGAAGLAVDIQTVSHLGGHPLPLVTCLTEQTSQGLTALNALSVPAFRAQFASIVADMPVAAVKIGLLPNLEIAAEVLQIIESLAKPAVLDPVLSASHGGVKPPDGLKAFICEEMLSRISLLTPNLPEISELAVGENNLQRVNFLLEKGLPACLLKGGHDAAVMAIDYYADTDRAFYVYQPRQDKQVRGTGCAMASAIAFNLANNMDMRDAVMLARAYLSRGIRCSESNGTYQLLAHGNQQVLPEDIPFISYQYKDIGCNYRFAGCPMQLGIYPVVDSADWVKRLLELGIQTIQLRLKEADDSLLIDEISHAVKIATAYPDSRLFINDHWQQAIAAGAYGVHLGQEDLHKADLAAIAEAGLRLGVSTHSYWELARALAIQPSYIALGPVYATDSKVMPWQPQGHEKVRQWLKLLDGKTPLVAIGGINTERARDLKKTGVGSVAMISSVTRAVDVENTVKSLLTIWRGTSQINRGMHSKSM